MRSFSFYRDRDSPVGTFPLKPPRYLELKSGVTVDPDLVVLNPETQYFECILCETQHPSVDCYIVHAKSRRHVNNKAWKEYEEMDMDPGKARMGDADLGLPPEIECRGSCWFKCTLCDCMLADSGSAAYHVVGRRHKQKLKRTTEGAQVPRPFRPAIPKQHLTQAVDQPIPMYPISDTPRPMPQLETDESKDTAERRLDRLRPPSLGHLDDPSDTITHTRANAGYHFSLSTGFRANGLPFDPVSAVGYLRVSPKTDRYASTRNCVPNEYVTRNGRVIPAPPANPPNLLSFE